MGAPATGTTPVPHGFGTGNRSGDRFALITRAVGAALRAGIRATATVHQGDVWHLAREHGTGNPPVQLSAAEFLTVLDDDPARLCSGCTASAADYPEIFELFDELAWIDAADDLLTRAPTTPAGRAALLGLTMVTRQLAPSGDPRTAPAVATLTAQLTDRATELAADPVARIWADADLLTRAPHEVAEQVVLPAGVTVAGVHTRPGDYAHDPTVREALAAAATRLWEDTYWVLTSSPAWTYAARRDDPSPHGFACALVYAAGALAGTRPFPDCQVARPAPGVREQVLIRVPEVYRHQATPQASRFRSGTLTVAGSSGNRPADHVVQALTLIGEARYTGSQDLTKLLDALDATHL